MPSAAGKNYHVTPAQAQQTLALALRQWLPGTSWSQVRKMLTSRQVMVNGNLCLDAARRLKPDEVVKVLDHPAAPLPRDSDVKIRYLDAHLVIVEKPAGMTSIRHVEERRWPARRKQLAPTLDEVLPRLIAQKDTRKGQAGGKPGRGKRQGVPPPVRPVHRIDRETSGLMVYARTVKAERDLGQQFRKHMMHRRYLAVVHGRVEAQTIESQLVRDRGDGRRGSSDDLTQGGKRAVTHVKPVEYLDGYTLIECRLETGRTHQIRIHLAELGHPLCGENVYHQPLFKPPRPDKSGAPRLALHAAELGLIHPTTGEKMSFTMPVPADLAGFIERLRGRMKDEG